MPGSSNNSSFIPKRGTTKHTRKVRNANIYILNILSYVLLFAALAASAAVYFYSNYVNDQLNSEIATMSDAVGNFKEADMKRVQEFDVRLQQATQRLDNSVSIISVLKAIESAVVDTVRFRSFSLIRNLDEDFIVQAVVDTDTFDSSIFQRNTFSGNATVEAVEVDNVVLQQMDGGSGQSTGQSVSFVVNLAFPLSSVPYQAPATKPIVLESVPIPEVVDEEVEPEAEEVVEETEGNQDDI